MKKALITGASKRIGKQIAKKLAKNGYDIVLHYYKSSNEAKELKTYLENKYNIIVSLVCANLLENNSAKKLYNQIDGQKPTVLVNNASLFEYDDIFTVSEESFEKHINIHLKSAVFLSQYFAQSLGENKGNIINILDQAVENISPYFLSYTLSKTALLSFTKIASMSLAPNIRVNAISPGPTIKSPFQTDDNFTEMCQNTLLKQPSQAKEIAKTVLYILNTSSITGQNIVVDAGYSLNKFGNFKEKIKDRMQ